MGEARPAAVARGPGPVGGPGAGRAAPRAVDAAERSMAPQADQGTGEEKRRMMPTSTTERKPSEVTDAFWLCAQGPPGRPNVVGQGGKWLVFVSHKYVDTVWAQIKQSTEAGRLGPAAKVATARPNSNARDPRSRVICVYTYDWKDEADVKRVREELRRLGITS